MTWEIIYHKDVDDDFKSIGPAAARRVLLAIDKKLTQAPEKFGAPLSNNLKNFMKLYYFLSLHPHKEIFHHLHITAGCPARLKRLFLPLQGINLL